LARVKVAVRMSALSTSVACPQQAGRKREGDHLCDATCYRLRVNQIPIKLEADDDGPNREEWSSVDDHSPTDPKPEMRWTRRAQML
jgi:hypothetical protein